MSSEVLSEVQARRLNEILQKVLLIKKFFVDELGLLEPFLFSRFSEFCIEDLPDEVARQLLPEIIDLIKLETTFILPVFFERLLDTTLTKTDIPGEKNQLYVELLILRGLLLDLQGEIQEFSSQLAKL